MVVNKKALFVTLVDYSKHTEARFHRIRWIQCAYKSLRCLGLKKWKFCAHNYDDDDILGRETCKIKCIAIHFILQV